MKPIYFLPFVLLLTALIAACNGGTDTQERGNITKAGPGAINDNAPSGLTVLTWRYLTRDRDIIAGYEQRTGAKVNVVVRPLREIIATAAAGQPLGADVVLLPTLEDAVRLRDFNALQPFFVDAFTNGDVADRYLDNEGYWAGLTRWTMINVYNPNAVTQEEASSYQGLVSVANRGIRVGAAHPDSSGLAGVVAALYTNVRPEAASVWADLMYQKTVGGLRGNDTDQLDRMLAGELDMAFVSLGAALRWFLDGNPTHFEAGKTWGMQYPRSRATDENYFNMTTVVMPARIANRSQSMRFINYLFDKEVNQQLASGWFEYPVQTFARPDGYITTLGQRLGLSVTGEELDQQIPAAWSIINQVAERANAQ